MGNRAPMPASIVSALYHEESEPVDINGSPKESLNTGTEAIRSQLGQLRFPTNVPLSLLCHRRMWRARSRKRLIGSGESEPVPDSAT